jgi:hypothetical protein
MRKLVIVVAATAAAAAACGRSPQEKQAEQIQKSADQMQKGAEGMAKGLEDMAKGLGAMAGDPNQKPVAPVSFHDLQTVVPDLPGWERGKPTGERMTSPVTYSQTSVTYTKGDATIDHKIVDSALNQLLVAPYTMFLAAGYEKETDDGYEKSVTIGEYPGWEKWDSSGKSGELNAIVAKRFIVQIEGHGIDDPKVLHELMERTDLKKLAGLK